MQATAELVCQGREAMNKSTAAALVLVLGMFLPRQAIATDSCPAVYFVRPPPFWGAYNAVVWEVLLKFDGDQDYFARGFLFNGDWGVLRVCATSFDMKVRLFVDPVSGRRSSRKTGTSVLNVKVGNRPNIFIRIDDAGTEMSEAEGRREILELERSARGPLARDLFGTDRYALICQSCGLRPPDFRESEQVEPPSSPPMRRQ